MFTGIVTAVGQVRAPRRERDGGLELTIDCP